jgi:hypothetical protein
LMSEFFLLLALHFHRRSPPPARNTHASPRTWSTWCNTRASGRGRSEGLSSLLATAQQHDHRHTPPCLLPRLRRTPPPLTRTTPSTRPHTHRSLQPSFFAGLSTLRGCLRCKTPACRPPPISPTW